MDPFLTTPTAPRSQTLESPLKKPVHKLLTVPLRSVLHLSLAPFVYYRNIKTDKIKRSLEIVSEHGVDTLEPMMLGGVEQWVLIRGHDVRNPVLLFLHGGPGLPLMPFHTINAELEKDFTVVHWDQRGSGKSYDPGIPPESMTLEQLIQDAHELIQHLRTRFQQDKIFLAGFSCGSAIGMNLVHRYPELFQTYIGIGQIANMAESEAISYEFAMEAAQKADNQLAITELELIGPPPYNSHRSMLEERMWINTFGGFFHHRKDNFKFYKAGLMSPDYSLTDIRKLFKGMDFTSEMLWPVFYQTNLFETVPRVEVPVYYIEGRHDYVVPSEVTARFVEQLDAPKGKELIWFEDSAHWPFLEEPARFHLELRRIRARHGGASRPKRWD